jgi:hypothetical protein
LIGARAPNISVCTRFASIPAAMSASVMSFMNSAGPHRYALASTGSPRFPSSSAVMRPWMADVPAGIGPLV